MVSSITKIPRFCLGIAQGFLTRCRHKGLNSGRIYVTVAINDFLIAQANKIRALHRVECPCCGWKGYDFYGEDTTKFWLRRVFCPGCRSHERQRMLQLYIDRHDATLGDTDGTLLHFAPEDDLRKLIRANPRLKYFSTDYVPYEIERRCEPGTAFMADIQQMGVADDSIDIVFCLHVLEHVRRDRDAIRELQRILKPNGIAYIMVPFDMTLDRTEEWETPDPDIHYHIWAYSTKDFKERLEGFDYEEIKPDTFLTEAERQRFRVPPKEIIYRCVKRTAVAQPVPARAAVGS